MGIFRRWRGLRVSWVTDGLSRAYLSQDGAWAPDRAIGEQLGPVPDEFIELRRQIRALRA